MRDNIDALADNLGERMSDVAFHDIGEAVSALEEQAGSLRSPDTLTVLAAARHLQAIDQSIQARARELGVRRPGGAAEPPPGR
ncbi:hypothetical protein [Cryobacterium tepidiphilum]|uniref:Uncharacterized protein n=1 Tax=Cryobacterium tepidiphilum TaxID=2486026 RepID=A0A3M8LDK3_9MICO|nr:hypothetical protein [Cryobacterium tepidiphilum]RNE63623.1 hypothetical protein EEJ31_06530 [Cryobacterium tepidiphilum]